MKKAIIYHNPRCSKSRDTLTLLQKHHIEPQVILYLESPPTVKQLKELLQLLNMKPRDLLRKSETEYKELNLDNTKLSDEAILKAMIQHPKLIERPIVVINNKAVLGRPPENILELL